MRNRRLVLFVPVAILFSFFANTAVLAQGSESYEEYEKKERWGRDQRVKEMLEYWRSWEMSGPDTNISVARQRGLQQFQAMPRSNRAAYKGQTPQATAAWEQVAASQGSGKNAVSGRATDIAFDPRDPDNILYLATSGGGLWKTTNALDAGGVKWVPISNSFGSYSMGAVAVHPENPDIVFAATGDLHDGDGDGLYKSTDAGLNWTRIASSGSTGISGRSNQLIINPRNPQTMYHTGADGVRRSYDGGLTWKKSLSGTVHLIVDPTDTNRLYAGCIGKIVRSTDGGATWSGDMATNITSKGRITLGFSEKDSSKVYASISNSAGVSIGVGVSTNFGASWSIADYEDYMAQQGSYDNACAASPRNANVVLVGGLDVWRSTSGGTALSKKTRWTSNEGSTDFTHADIHVIKYSPNGGKVYVLSDGGVYVSGNDGQSWSSLNNDLGTLLFVGFDVAPDLSYVIGGTQDNGTNRAASGITSFTQTEGGDGGRVFVDQQEGTTVFSTHYGADLFRSTTRGTGNWVYGLLQGTALEQQGTPFYMYYDVCASDASYVALLSLSNVFFSEDAVSSIAQISTNGMSPKTVHVAPADPYYLYVGSGSGYIYTTTDAGGTWTKSTTRIGSHVYDSKQWTIANIVSDPSDARKAWTATAGYGGKKFWLTEDGGNIWTSPATNFPDVSCQAIVRAPNGHLFIGHGFGVLRSVDNGVTWEPVTDGMPLADVKQLRVRGDYLYAGTYGHSIYRIKYKEITTPGAEVVAHQEDPNFKIASIFPNPVANTVEVRYQTSTDSKVMITLFDELGRQIRLLANEFNYAGEHTLRTDLGDLPSGTYSVVIAANGKALSERLVVTH